MDSFTYSISKSDPDFVLVIWADRVSTLHPKHRQELESVVVDQEKPIVFDFTATRVIGSKWVLLIQHLLNLAQGLGRKLMLVGLDEIFSERVKLLEIYDSLEPHCYASLTEVRRLIRT